MIKTETVTPIVGRYVLAGWLAIASAILLVPQMALALVFQHFFGRHPVWTMLVAISSIVGLLIGVYVLYMFRRLLNERWSFHAADTVVTALIVLNIVSSVIGLVGLVGGAEVAAGIASSVLFVPFGIITILFGVKVLKLEGDLSGLLKPFAYINIGFGICVATIILSPFGLLLGVASLVVEGMIFLRAGEDVAYL